MTYLLSPDPASLQFLGCLTQYAPKGAARNSLGAWDSLIEPALTAPIKFPPSVQTRRPDRRLDLGDDGAVLFAMTNTFMTGMTLRVAGGEPLV